MRHWQSCCLVRSSLTAPLSRAMSARASCDVSSVPWRRCFSRHRHMSMDLDAPLVKDSFDIRNEFTRLRIYVRAMGLPEVELGTRSCACLVVGAITSADRRERRTVGRQDAADDRPNGAPYLAPASARFRDCISARCFLGAAMRMLKRGAYIGAVNTDVVSAEQQPPTVTTVDWWDVATMLYGSFPIFTRRYIEAGLATLLSTYCSVSPA